MHLDSPEPNKIQRASTGPINLASTGASCDLDTFAIGGCGKILIGLRFPAAHWVCRLVVPMMPVPVMPGMFHFLEPMMKNKYATRILQQMEDREVTGAQFRMTLEKFVESMRGCMQKEADAALKQIAPAMASRNLSRASLVSRICGSMVESGCDSNLMARALTTGLAKALETALPLAAKLESKVAPKLEGLDDEEKITRWKASAIRQLSVRLPEAAAGLKAVERFVTAAVIVYSQNLSAREHALPLLWDNTSRLEPWNTLTEQLMKVLSVLENEWFVVIDIANSKGFTGQLGGVIDNSQLLILLMDAYAGQQVFAKPLVPHDVVQSAKGLGPCDVDQAVEGVWNVYTFEALSAILKLPDPKDLKANKYWIRNEKTPADIPVVHGHRVILLGPPSYPRTWKFKRQFKHLKAYVTVDSELSKTDMQIWLDRIVARNANRAIAKS